MNFPKLVRILGREGKMRKKLTRFEKQIKVPNQILLQFTTTSFRLASCFTFKSKLSFYRPRVSIRLLFDCCFRYVIAIRVAIHWWVFDKKVPKSGVQEGTVQKEGCEHWRRGMYANGYALALVFFWAKESTPKTLGVQPSFVCFILPGQFLIAIQGK